MSTECLPCVCDELIVCHISEQSILAPKSEEISEENSSQERRSQLQQALITRGWSDSEPSLMWVMRYPFSVTPWTGLSPVKTEEEQVGWT